MVKAEKLSAIITEVWGDRSGALKTASQEIGVNYDNLRKMRKGDRPIPQWIFDKLSNIKAAQDIPFFDSSEYSARDGKAIVAPTLENLVERTDKAGWDRSLILSAIEEWASCS